MFEIQNPELIQRYISIQDIQIIHQYLQITIKKQSYLHKLIFYKDKFLGELILNQEIEKSVEDQEEVMDKNLIYKRKKSKQNMEEKQFQMKFQSFLTQSQYIHQEKQTRIQQNYQILDQLYFNNHQDVEKVYIENQQNQFQLLIINQMNFKSAKLFEHLNSVNNVLKGYLFNKQITILHQNSNIYLDFQDFKISKQQIDLYSDNQLFYFVCNYIKPYLINSNWDIVAHYIKLIKQIFNEKNSFLITINYKLEDQMSSLQLYDFNSIQQNVYTLNRVYTCESLINILFLQFQNKMNMNQMQNLVQYLNKDNLKEFNQIYVLIKIFFLGQSLYAKLYQSPHLFNTLKQLYFNLNIKQELYQQVYKIQNMQIDNIETVFEIDKQSLNKLKQLLIQIFIIQIQQNETIFYESIKDSSLNYEKHILLPSTAVDIIRNTVGSCHLLYTNINKYLSIIIKCLNPSIPMHRKINHKSCTQALHLIYNLMQNVDYSQKYQKYAVGTNSGEVIIYDLKTAEKYNTLKNFSSSVDCIKLKDFEVLSICLQQKTMVIQSYKNSWFGLNQHKQVFDIQFQQMNEKIIDVM